jgi:hypothetical protein
VDLLASFRLPESAEAFREKMRTLGEYLGEKQKTLLGWFLVYVPFLSLVIGALGINVRGYTSLDGLTLQELGLAVALISAGYFAVVLVSGLLLARRISRRPGADGPAGSSG